MKKVLLIGISILLSQASFAGFDFLTSKNTHFDMDGNGQNETATTYYQNGNVKKQITYTLRNKQYLREVYTSNYEGSQTNLKIYYRRELIKEMSVFFHNKILEKRIIQTQNEKIEEILNNMEIISYHYKKTKSGWELKEEERRAALFSQGEAYPQCPGEEKIEENVASKCQSIRAYDRKTGLDQIILGAVHLQCKRHNLLETASNFRIDLDSCKTQDERDKVLKATESLVNEKLACLKGLNPNLHKDFLLSLKQNRPIIKCTPKAKNICDELDGVNSSNGAQSKSSYCSSLAKSTGAFTIPEAQGKPIFLTQYAPSSDEYTHERLTSTLFHEALHHVAHSGPNHNHGDPDDAVYGCQELCQSPASQETDASRLTKKGCQKCLKAAGNTDFNMNRCEI
jgi:hypothetical protein